MHAQTLGKKQKGVTFTGWLIILLLIGFFAMLGLKIVPIYMENYTVKQIVNGIKTEPMLSSKSATEIKKIIMHRIDINHIYDLTKDEVKVKKGPRGLKVSVDYTVRKNIVGNLDIIATFSEKAEL